MKHIKQTIKFHMKIHTSQRMLKISREKSAHQKSLVFHQKYLYDFHLRGNPEVQESYNVGGRVPRES